ncbi:MAG: hypothetical protein IPK04_06510 [Bdellovibrionales bacterium]|nr:hypothetical protein [Bdellovibrionales bacterium]
MFNRNSPNFLSQSNPLIDYMGGTLNNLSVLDDNGQENGSTQEEAKKFAPFLWVHNTAPEWHYYDPPLPTVDCLNGETFTFATAARMVKPSETYLTYPLVGEIEKPFHRTGQLGLFFKSSCNHHKQLLQFLNSKFGRRSEWEINLIPQPKSLVIACRDSMSEYIVRESERDLDESNTILRGLSTIPPTMV